MESSQLLRWLAEDPTAPVDLAEVALAIAKDEYPNLDVSSQLVRIDNLADVLAPRVSSGSLMERLGELCDFLFEEIGFQGNSSDYYDPRNSYLNQVLDRKLGIPITLSLLAMLVGQRAGMDIVGIGLPGHFIAMARQEEQTILFDPFHGGQVLTVEACAELASAITGTPLRVEQLPLAPVSPAALVQRLLRNLRNIYENQSDWPRTARTLDRLRLLSPNDVALHRDLGAAYLGASQPGKAIPWLQSYLRAEPTATDAPQVQLLLQRARTEIARWN